MSVAADWLDLHQVEAELCTLTAGQLGLDPDEVKPESRLIEEEGGYHPQKATRIQVARRSAETAPLTNRTSDTQG